MQLAFTVQWCRLLLLLLLLLVSAAAAAVGRFTHKCSGSGPFS
jgi:hypothetical protein